MINRNEFFKEVTLRICGNLDIEQALSQTFQYLQKIMPVDAIGLGYNNLDLKRMYTMARVSNPGAVYVWNDEKVEVELSDEVVNFIRTNPDRDASTIIVNNPEKQPDFMLEIFPGLRTESAIFQMLEVIGGRVGVLLVSASGFNRYSSEHAGLIKFVREPFAIAMSNARRFRDISRMRDLLAEDNMALLEDMKRSVGGEIVGADFGLKGVMEQVRQIALSNSPTLLLGETGTGKEIIAGAIHKISPRSNGPMISMQCGAIPDTLLDSELFGHERGAFTGATDRKRGRFERADGGTLFLDEIGELSLDAQVKLLRVLQEHTFERVGGIKSISTDVRVIAATHRDLEKMVRHGSFREDLWYRLNVLPIRIPPLRLRREDIPSLVQYFIERKVQEMNLKKIPKVKSLDIEKLKAYDWPCNVRELQNIVERSLILSKEDYLTFPELAIKQTETQTEITCKRRKKTMTLDEANTAYLKEVLEQVNWQVAGKGGAAEVLQINPSTLRFRMKKLGLKLKKSISEN